MSPDAMEHIVIQSEKRETGARGLHTELVATIEDAAFEAFMRIRNATVAIVVDNGQLKCETR